MKILNFIILSIICIILASIFSILLFYVPVFDFMPVLMYKGIIIISVTSILLFIILLVLKHTLKCNYDIKDILCIVIIFICINITFFTLVPVTVERSISVFTLSQIEEIPNDTITIEGAESLFNNKYLKSNQAFKKRFDEQVITGSLKKNPDGSYTLTNLGHFLVKAFRTIGKIYNADCKNLY